MIKIKAFLFILILLSASVAGGSPGSSGVLESLDHRDKLYDIVQQGKSLWIVGYPGRLLRSPDEGQTWSLVEIESKEALMAIDFADDKNGVIVGRSGTILRTTDGGQKWTLVKTEIKEPLFDLDMVNASVGFAVGHFNTILSTSDGGATWKNQFYELPEDAEDEPGLHAVSFVDPQNGWIAGEFGTILHTSDGGTTWQSQQSGTSLSLYDVHFKDALNGRAVGAGGTVLGTVDGGVTWTMTGDVDPEHPHLFAFHESPDGHLRAVGQEGMFLEQAPLQKSLKKSPMKIYTWLDSVTFLNSKTGFAIGGRGHIMTTADGGRTWKRLSGQ